MHNGLRMPVPTIGQKPEAPPHTMVRAETVGPMTLLRITRHGADHHDAQMDLDCATSVMVQIGASIQSLAGNQHLRNILVEWMKQLDA